MSGSSSPREKALGGFYLAKIVHLYVLYGQDCGCINPFDRIRVEASTLVEYVVLCRNISIVI